MSLCIEDSSGEHMKHSSFNLSSSHALYQKEDALCHLLNCKDTDRRKKYKTKHSFLLVAGPKGIQELSREKKKTLLSDYRYLL